MSEEYRGCSSLADIEKELEENAKAIQSQEKELLEALGGKGEILAVLVGIESKEQAYSAILQEMSLQITSDIASIERSIAEGIDSQFHESWKLHDRVSDTLEVMNNILDLSDIVEQAAKEFASGDVETAVGHIDRYMDLVTGSDSPNLAPVEFQELRSILRSAVIEKFHEIVKSGKESEMNVLGRLLAPLQENDEGMILFCEFFLSSLEKKLKSHTESARGSSSELIERLTKILEVSILEYDSISEFASKTFNAAGTRRLVSEIASRCNTICAELVESYALESSVPQKEKFMVNFAQEAKELSQLPEDTLRRTETVLEEITVISQRVELFSFLMAKELDPIGKSNSFIMLDRLKGAVAEVTSHYSNMEVAFMRVNVRKAVQVNGTSSDSSGPTVNDTIVGDFFFVLQKSCSRALFSRCIKAILRVFKSSAALVSGYLAEIFEREIQTITRQQLPLASEKQTQYATQTGSLAGLANAISLADHNTNHLRMDLERAIQRHFPPPSSEAKILSGGLIRLEDSRKVFMSKRGEYLQTVLQMIRPSLSDALKWVKQASYDKSDDKQIATDASNKVIIRTTSSLGLVLDPFAEYLREELQTSFMPGVAHLIAEEVEEIVFRKKFTRAGAIQIENDVRSLGIFFTSKYRHTVRRDFSRLYQVLAVLNTESIDDLREIWEDRVSWGSRFSAELVKKICGLRCDLTGDDVAAFEREWRSLE